MNLKSGFARSVVIATLLAATAFTGSAIAAAQKLIIIGTGGVTGVYYPAGGAICRLVNRERKHHGIRCSVESTDGSVYNLNSIRAGELDFAVVQSDWQHHAFHGTGKFKKAGPFDNLRALFSIHPEPFTVVARKDSGISTFQDLKGKRVNIGNPGSGQRGTMEVVMTALGWKPADFKPAFELKSSEQSKAMCNDKVDAIVFTVGHPSGSIKEATTSCNAVLVPVTGPEIDKLVARHDYYRKAVIPAGMYRGTATDTPTFGVSATFVTSASVPDEIVYQIVKAVFENFDRFRKLHPAFANLKKDEMIEAGRSAPLHPGATRYYREAGLIK